MHLLERGLAREIATSFHRDAAVERRRELHDHERPALRDPRNEPLVELACCRLEHSLRHGNVRRAKEAEALPVGARVGVAHRGDDALDARLVDRVDAWWCASRVRAGLQRGVQRRAASAVPRLAEGDDLRVRLAGRAMEPVADDLAVAHDHRADHGIWTRAPGRPRREAQRAPHELDVLGFAHSAKSRPR